MLGGGHVTGGLIIRQVYRFSVCSTAELTPPAASPTTELPEQAHL